MRAVSRRVGRFIEGFSAQISESALRRWLGALQDGADGDEGLEGARRLGRLGPQAQEAAAAVVARLAGSEAELRRVLGELERWSHDHDLEALAHFIHALRARSSLPHPAADPNEEQDEERD